MLRYELEIFLYLNTDNISRGLFLNEIVCRNVSREDVIKKLISILNKKKYKIISQEKVCEITGRENQYEVSNEIGGWVQIFTPEIQDKDLAIELSKQLNSLIFSFHICDGVFWMYELFDSGELKDKFNPIPNYWKEIDNKEKLSYKGNSLLLSKLFNVPHNKLKPYLVFWNEIKDEDKKAFPKDGSPIQSEWSMTDFQQKLGIIYPDFEKSSSVDFIRLTFKKKTLGFF